MKSIVLFFVLMFTAMVVFGERPDRSHYAIIRYTIDAENRATPIGGGDSDSAFQTPLHPITLTQGELNMVLDLYEKSIKEYNQKVFEHNRVYPGGRKMSTIDGKRNNYLQIVPVTNKKGERMVWVNCLCGLDPEDDKIWRKRVIVVNDGGTCFFRFSINLKKGSYFDFEVNGAG